LIYGVVLNVDQEFSVTKRLENGLLEFKLDGKKLKGKWRLVKIKGKTRDWLQIKGNDEYAGRTGNVSRDRPESVVSGR
jgi:bifunctional non-homologous end joining protein LigD